MREPIETVWLICGARLSQDRDIVGALGGRSGDSSPPFDSGARDQRYCDHAQTDHNYAFHRSIVLVRIPTGHELDPIWKHRSDKREQTG
jgi:hypothetical protein